jgi:ubiquinone/menaquinone biosynthesis C-methylase UbiE
MDGLKLHIGCGRTSLEGFVNIDIIPGCDVTLNLNTDRLPFEDNSVDCIFSYHALEHIDNYLFALGEMWRVLKHGGIFFAETPYVTLSEYNLVNPFHVRHFNEFSFDFFDTAKLGGSANEDTPIAFKSVWNRYHYLPRFAKLPDPVRTFCRRHFFNVVRAIDFGLYAVKDASNPTTSFGSADALQTEFDSIVERRRPAAWA